MGYIRHHAVVITSWDRTLLEIIRDEAQKLCPGQVSNIVKSSINAYESFFIGPDGSKEGWKQSDAGDEKREKIVDLIDSVAYSDGSNAVSYAELFYSDDEGKAEIVNHN
jgi:spore cortex formation protein SpoVR/YcgB (stage V sporulation)